MKPGDIVWTGYKTSFWRDVDCDEFIANIERDTMGLLISNRHRDDARAMSLCLFGSRLGWVLTNYLSELSR